MRFAGAAFGISAMFELLAIGSATPLFGALRGGAPAIVYHTIYVGLFAALAAGLWLPRPWGYRLLLAGCCFYTADNLRYVLDRDGMRALIEQQIGSFQSVRRLVDFDSMMQVATLTAALSVACWWGFALYARRRRAYFAS
jgi:hypothetical protein